MIEFVFELTSFDAAEIDVEKAKRWYYDQNPDTDLEERFADSIKEVIRKLHKNPYRYNLRFENIRVAHPKTFPYGVHFFIDEDKKQITIIGIFHNKQDSSEIKKRL
jgi:plasmid stabilization system protein ParE